MLLLNISDTASISQDGSSLKFIAVIADRQCYIQDASCRGLCSDIQPSHYKLWDNFFLEAGQCSSIVATTKKSNYNRSCQRNNFVP